MEEQVRVLVAGVGHMGLSHALAYHALDGFDLAGLVSRHIASQELPPALDGVPRFNDFHGALAETKPDAVSVNTWADTHAEFAIAAMNSGAHVFVEKPLATTVEEAERVVATAKKQGKKLVVGYILRHHPSWTRLVELGRTLGKPLVMRMNLNQQSSGEAWTWHKDLMQSLSPIVDCGVHYVDVMCQLTGCQPVRVHAVGARLTDDIAPEMYNYGHLHVTFEDGSVGWYEAGWGPMMSEVAFFVKDVVGPKGSVSIVMRQDGDTEHGSADMETHTKTSMLRLHHSDIDAGNHFTRPDETIDMADEPGHQELCDREQAFFLEAIREDVDLTRHMEDAVNSLRVVLAADESIRGRRVVELEPALVA
ncbi:MAG: Gfo/Idh/MocA family protein [Alphaproteobacteria bacterium]